MAADHADVADLVKKVASKIDEWPKVSNEEKLGILERIRDKVEANIEEWGKLCNASRHYEDTPHLHGTGLMIGPGMAGIHLTVLINTYKSIVATGKPPEGKVRQVGNQTVVETYPMNTWEKLFFPGTVELWLEPGKSATQMACKKETGLVAILGPGNYEAPNDILSAMFCESKVVVYSPHPNLAKSNAVFYKRFFKELIDAGYLGLIEPSSDVPVMRAKAAALLKCPELKGMVITGGCQTYDAIVWGPDGKKKGKKAFDKPVSAELGACSPWIVTPGKWSEGDLDHHAKMLAANKLMNSSAICASPQLLMVQKEWPQREAFVKKVEATLKSAKNCGDWPVFYPGTEQRVDAAKKAYPSSKVTEIGDLGGINPLVLHLDEGDHGSFTCKNEAFSPVLAEVPISASDAKDFLAKAQKLSNSDEVFGSLSCSVMIPDSVLEEMGGSTFLDEWLKTQEWGTTAVNEWGGFGAVLGSTAWGAFPKHTAEDIQSGQGWVNNYLMYDNVQKTVIKSPFKSPGHPKGPSTLDDAAAARCVAWFAIRPSVKRLVPLLATAILGRNGPVILGTGLLACTMGIAACICG